MRGTREQNTSASHQLPYSASGLPEVWPGFVWVLSTSIFPPSPTGERVRKNRSEIAKKRKKNCSIKSVFWGFPGGAVVGNPPANAGDTGSSPGLGGSHMPRSS